MGRKRAATGKPPRVQLGPFWLWYRADRDDWSVCWYDEGGAADHAGAKRERRTCRKSTGIGGGAPDQPPQAALDALSDHYVAWRKPVEQPVTEAMVENIMADYLLQHADKKLADPVRYATSVGHWQRFFAIQRKAGILTGAPRVSDIKRALVERFIDWRIAEGLSPHTVSRDTAALRQSLNWAWKNEIIASAPFVPDVPNKPGGRELVYTVDQVAALLEAAWALEERRHVHLYAMIMLSTHGRSEAVLELEHTQVQDGLIYFNAPGRRQTKKRRSIVPIAPTLAPWLEGCNGRVIQWQRRRIDPRTRTETFESLPANSIKNAFEGCLLAAGICEHASDADGEPLWLPPRARLGETKPRPKLVGIGSPNTLRHTVATEMHRRGVPDAQIDAAAGHAGEGTNKRHYRHLRPDYLSDFIEGVEDFWSEVGRLTKVHLRYQRDTKVVDLAASRVHRKGKKS